MTGTFLYYIVYLIVHDVVFWCVGIPVAVLFAAYLIGIVVMCTKELWETRERDRKGAPEHEKTDPSL